MLAFGITTQNRKNMFFETLIPVTRYAPDDSRICIHDDASTDGTWEEFLSWKQHRGDHTYPSPLINAIRSDRIVGVAKSKQAIIQFLLLDSRVTDIFLIEDDVVPLADNWFDVFLKTAREQIHAHLLWMPWDVKYGPNLVVSSGEYPIGWKSLCSGLVMYFRASLLREIGGFETRFARYGYDHNEISSRAMLAQWEMPKWYPHCIAADRENVLLSRDIEYERQFRGKFLPSSTSDDSGGGNERKKALARENKEFYVQLMDNHMREYDKIANKTPEERRAHRARYFNE